MKTKRLPGYVVVLVGALAVMLAGLVPVRQIIGQRRAVENAEIRLADLRAENDRLLEEAAGLRSDTEIERRAREDFGFVSPGETPYVIVGTPATSQPPPPTVEEVEGDRTWIEAIFDFITGRDLGPDG